MANKTKKSGTHIAAMWGAPLYCYDATVILYQTAPDAFNVRYGLQLKSGLDYAAAAAEFGACVMHASACNSHLDNRTRDEWKADGRDALHVDALPSLASAVDALHVDAWCVSPDDPVDVETETGDWVCTTLAPNSSVADADDYRRAVRIAACVTFAPALADALAHALPHVDAARRASGGDGDITAANARAILAQYHKARAAESTV